MKCSTYILFFSILIGLTQCKNGLFDAGDTNTKEFIITEPFRTIEIQKEFAIELVNDTINKAVVTCGTNLMDDLSIETKDDVLYLNHDIKYNWSRDYEKVKLVLHLKSISWITVRKPCSISTTDTFKTDNFVFVDYGKFTDMNVCLKSHYIQIVMSSDNFGRFVLKGSSNYADIWQWGSAFIFASEMKFQNCNIDHRSVGDVYVNVANELKVNLKSTGNVYCFGNPQNVIIEQQLSTGQLFLKN